jgi:hypothetical protein
MGFGSFFEHITAPIERIFHPVIKASGLPNIPQIAFHLADKIALGQNGPTATQSHQPVPQPIYGQGPQYYPSYGGGGYSEPYINNTPQTFSPSEFGGAPSWGYSTAPMTYYPASTPTYLAAPAAPPQDRTWEDIASLAIPFLL